MAGFILFLLMTPFSLIGFTWAVIKVGFLKGYQICILIIESDGWNHDG